MSHAPLPFDDDGRQLNHVITFLNDELQAPERQLSLAEQGALQVLNWAYLKGGPLAADCAVLARVLPLDAIEVNSVIERFPVHSDGKRWPSDARILRRRQEELARSAKLVARATAGADARWKRQEAPSVSHPTLGSRVAFDLKKVLDRCKSPATRKQCERDLEVARAELGDLGFAKAVHDLCCKGKAIPTLDVLRRFARGAPGASSENGSPVKSEEISATASDMVRDLSARIGSQPRNRGTT